MRLDMCHYTCAEVTNYGNRYINLFRYITVYEAYPFYDVTSSAYGDCVHEWGECQVVLNVKAKFTFKVFQFSHK